jgi:ArsR family transcriptional regulator, arsenate/arsenite/antimonite-responsive transcriptional repressor
MSRPLTIVQAPPQRCCAPAAAPLLADGEVVALTAAVEVLAHPVRLRLLAELAGSAEAVCVCDLEASVPVKQPTVSHHLKILRSAGLVVSEKRGLWAYYSVRTDELQRLRRRITAGLDRLCGGDDE